MSVGQGLHLVEGPEDLHIRIEVTDRFTGPVQHQVQQPRLHRGGQLQQVVDGGHQVELATGEVELVWTDHVERLVAPIDAVLHVVENENGEPTAVLFRQ